ncbi:DUF6255 family natural product biosynthesis protein [Streptomyces sp. NPDC050610]|uniref:DUF6255 family natural product biosynthesis protein n=1 Tax=Streptomyces sp. NPDC050610 TaxID=3157097 RepID=UPI003413FC84
MTSTRRTSTAFGYAPQLCDHATGWGEREGVSRCPDCGTERTESYESLRLPPHVPDGTDQLGNTSCAPRGGQHPPRPR